MRLSSKSLRAYRVAIAAAASGDAPELASLLKSLGWRRRDDLATRREMESQDRRLAAAVAEASSILPIEWRRPLLEEVARKFSALKASAEAKREAVKDTAE